MSTPRQVDTSEPRRLLAQRVGRVVLTLLVLASAYLGAYLIRFEFRIPPMFLRTALLTLPLVLIGKLLLLRFFGTHLHSWRYTSLGDVLAITRALLAGAAVLLVLRIAGVEALRVLGQPGPIIPLGVIAADLALSLIGLVGVRALRRLQHEETETRRRRAAGLRAPRRRVLVIGAGRVGGQLARELLARPDLGREVIGFLDDDPALQHQVIHGIEVLGRPDELGEVAAERQVDQAVIALPEATGSRIRELTESCRIAGVEHRILPGVDGLLAGQIGLQALRPTRIEDLLRREPVDLDLSAITEVVAGRTVMVTGAGGSIGAELCRQLLRFGPARLVLVDRAEPALWAVHHELASAAASKAASATSDTPAEPASPDVQIVASPTVVPVLADVCDMTRVDALIAAEAPMVVFHAAAHKHVPIMEDNPGEAVRNNVLGTRTVADSCARHGVDRFVLVSTDKAVNPTSVMGASKRIAERYIGHLAATTGRVFVSVRFGNVLGSTGSVVPIFEAQIEAGGPVTVTHPDMARYFMTIPEASQLVIQAAALGTGGEVFLLDMGEPVRIVDLARDLIRLSGYEPETQIPIVFTGIRPGEKLFEDLSLDHEQHEPTGHPSIVVVRDGREHQPDVDAEVATLAAVVDADPSEVRRVLHALVPSLPPTVSASSSVMPPAPRTPASSEVAPALAPAPASAVAPAPAPTFPSTSVPSASAVSSVSRAGESKPTAEPSDAGTRPPTASP